MKRNKISPGGGEQQDLRKKMAGSHSKNMIISGDVGQSLKIKLSSGVEQDLRNKMAGRGEKTR